MKKTAKRNLKKAEKLSAVSEAHYAAADELHKMADHLHRKSEDLHHKVIEIRQAMAPLRKKARTKVLPNHVDPRPETTRKDNDPAEGQ